MTCEPIREGAEGRSPLGNQRGLYPKSGPNQLVGGDMTKLRLAGRIGDVVEVLRCMAAAEQKQQRGNN